MAVLRSRRVEPASNIGIEVPVFLTVSGLLHIHCFSILLRTIAYPGLLIRCLRSELGLVSLICQPVTDGFLSRGKQAEIQACRRLLGSP